MTIEGTRQRAFTLIELLVVIALIASLSAVLLGGLRDHRSAALQSAQATLANLVSTARTRAMATGKRTRLLVQMDFSTQAGRGRFLRVVAVQSAIEAGSAPGSWETISLTKLPGMSFVLPRVPADFAKLIDATSQDWRRPADTSKPLGSSVFAGNSASIDLQDGHGSEQVQGVMFTERGTISRLDGGGLISDTQIELIVAVGTDRPGDEIGSNESPVSIGDPNSVRGLCISTYGVPTLINDRESF